MYNWIESTFNVSGGATQVIAAILALIAVLLLFSVFVFVLKRLTGASTPQNRSRQPRIAVMDSTNVDARRQLVLIRRDNVEHLLLVGGPSDLVVEQNIVRNAPIAAQRQPASTAPLGNGSGTLKTPTAPGPDIPARPDEAARQPVAAISRQEPVPAVPLKARAESAVRPAPKAAAASAMVRPVSPLKVEDKSPAAAASVIPPVARQTQEAVSKQAQEPIPKQAVEPVSKQTLEREAGARPDRAADLLRAATQNGFNRSKNAAPAVRQDATGEPVVSDAPKVRTEPEIGAALTIKEEEEPNQAPDPDLEQVSPQGDEGASAPLKSLGRSIAARERSTQAAHTITPPSSGPAARAKTALLNPVQSPKTPDESGYVFKEQDPSDLVTVPVDPAANGDSGQSGAVTRNEEKLKFSDLFENTEKFDWGEGEAAETAGGDAVSGDVPADTEPSASEEATPAPRKEIKLDLELDDLIDGEAQEPASASAVDDVSVAPVDPPHGPEVQPSGSPEQTTKQSAALDIVPGAEPAAPRVVQGLGDKNPIEDEMAKILFELGGQQNR